MPWRYSPIGAQGMVLDAAVDPNVLSYPVPSIMREWGTVVRRGGANPWTSGEAEPSPRGSGEAEPSPRGSGEAESSPQPSDEAEPSPSHRGRQSWPTGLGRGGTKTPVVRARSAAVLLFVREFLTFDGY